MIRAQFKAARRYLRQVPSLWNPMPSGIPSAIWDMAYESCVDRPQPNYLGKYWQHRGGEKPDYMQGTFGCQCDSCKATTYYTYSGFGRWPKGEPKGAAASAKEYKAHQAECGSAGLPKPFRFVPGKPPQFPAWMRGNGPITPAPKFVLDYIASMKLPPEPVAQVKELPRLVALARELRQNRQLRRAA